MKKIRTAAVWIFLLQKRYILKPVFLLLLLLVPVLSFAAGLIPSGTESLIRVALACEDPSDETASSIIYRMEAESSPAISYYVCSGEEEMTEDIRSGKARLGILFPKNTAQLFSEFSKIDENESSTLSILGGILGDAFSSQGKANTGRIRVLAGSNDIVTKLTKEHVYGKLYRDLELSILKSWMDLHAGGFAMNKEERDSYLEEAMDNYHIDDNLFTLSYLNDESISSDDNAGYLSAPLRGILTVLMVLTGCAAALTVMQDREEGRYIQLKKYQQALVHYAGVLIPVADCALFVLIALKLSGSFRGLQKEIPELLLYSLCVAGFCSLLRAVLKKRSLLASFLPVLIPACLFLTPVFLSVTVYEPAQALLPPWSYLNCIYGRYSLQSMVLYALVSGLCAFLLDCLSEAS